MRLILLLICIFFIVVKSSTLPVDSVLASFSQTTYKEPKNHFFTHNGTCYPFTFMSRLEHPGAHGDVFFSDALQWMVLAWRGTHDFDDVLTDVKIKKVRCDMNGFNCGTVHDGFYKSYSGVMNQIPLQFIQAKKGYKLYVTGHSLGGAIAIFNALDLSTRGLKVDRLVTFGQPRVGNADFSSFFRRYPIAFERYVKTYKGIDDVITQLPMFFDDINTASKIKCGTCDDNTLLWGTWYFLHGMYGYEDTLR